MLDVGLEIKQTLVAVSYDQNVKKRVYEKKNSLVKRCAIKTSEGRF